MEKLFLELLNIASDRLGDIKEAVLYNGDTYASLKVDAETDNGKYSITIGISKKVEEKENA